MAPAPELISSVLIELEPLQGAALHSVDTGAFLEIPAPYPTAHHEPDSKD